MEFPKTLILVFLTVFIDTLGISFVSPIIPFLTTSLGGTSGELGILYSSYCVTQIFSVYIMGTLSDKMGRKLFLILSLCGSTFGPILQAFSNNMLTLIITRAATGLLSGSMTVAQAYIADVIPADKRAIYISQLTAISCFSFIFGPAIGGVLGQISLRTPFFAAGICAGIVLILSIFFLHETNDKIIQTQKLKKEKKTLLKSKISLSEEQRERLDAIDKEIKEINKPVAKESQPKAHWNLFMILSLIQKFGGDASMALIGTVSGLYLVDEAGFDSFLYSLMLCINGFVAFVVPMFIFPLLIKQCKLNIVGISIVGALIMAIGFALAAFNHNTVCGFLTIHFLTFGFSLGASLCPILLSVQAPQNVQGSVLSISSMTSPITGIIFPTLGGYVYEASHSWSVLIGTILGIIMFIVSLIIYVLPGGKQSVNAKEDKKEDEKEGDIETSNKQNMEDTKVNEEDSKHDLKEEETTTESGTCNNDSVSISISTVSNQDINTTPVVHNESIPVDISPSFL